MVKGINRAVIEINDTDNPYIERAILFVNPEFIGADKQITDEKAKKYLAELTLPSYCKKNTQKRTEVYKRRLKFIKLASLAAVLLLVVFAMLIIIK